MMLKSAIAINLILEVHISERGIDLLGQRDSDKVWPIKDPADACTRRPVLLPSFFPLYSKLQLDIAPNLSLEYLGINLRPRQSTARSD